MKALGSLFLLFCLSMISVYQARGEEADQLLRCSFGPKVRLLSPQWDELKGKDRCTGSAKIQAVRWECNQPAQLELRTRDFFNELNETAQARCEEHCKERMKNCIGEYKPQRKCGLENDLNDAIEGGKRAGCRPSCAGTAFIYCSLYDAGYKTEFPELIQKQAANCFCRLQDSD